MYCIADIVYVKARIAHTVNPCIEHAPQVLNYPSTSIDNSVRLCGDTRPCTEGSRSRQSMP